MRATRLMAARDIRTAEVPVPDPGPGEVLIRIEAAGICGTDRHLFKGEFPCTPPVTLGHEFSGIVVGRGAGVDIARGRARRLRPQRLVRRAATPACAAG